MTVSGVRGIRVEDRPQVSPWHLGFVALFGLACLAGMAQCYSIIAVGRASWKWPSVPGDLIRTERYKSDEGGFILVARYRYEVSGVPYRSSRFDVGLGNNTFDEPPPEVSRTPLTVYHDPEHPDFSVLRRGVPPDWTLGFAACLAFLSLALLSVLHPRGRRMFRNVGPG